MLVRLPPLILYIFHPSRFCSKKSPCPSINNFLIHPLTELLFFYPSIAFFEVKHNYSQNTPQEKPLPYTHNPSNPVYSQQGDCCLMVDSLQIVCVLVCSLMNGYAFIHQIGCPKILRDTRKEVSFSTRKELMTQHMSSSTSNHMINTLDYICGANMFTCCTAENEGA